MRSYDSIYDIEGGRIGLVGSGMTVRDNIFFERDTINVMQIVVICLASIGVILTILLIYKKFVVNGS